MAFFNFLVVFLMLTPLAGAAEVPYSAIVMDLTGKVEVVREGTRKPADLGSLLYPNDVVETAGNASLTINYPESGQEEQWPGGMKFSVRKTQSEPISDRVIIRNRKIVLPQIESPQIGGITLRGSDLDGGPGTLKVKGLSNSRTLDARPTFRWGSISGADRYQVALYLKSQNEPLWQRTTAETQMPYPQSDPPLNLGQHYEWEVQALKDGKIIAKKRSCFYLPASIEVTSINEQKKKFAAQFLSHPKDIAARLAFIFFLEQHRLYDEAVEQYETLRKMRQESDTLKKREERLLQLRFSSCNLDLLK